MFKDCALGLVPEEAAYKNSGSLVLQLFIVDGEKEGLDYSDGLLESVLVAPLGQKGVDYPQGGSSILGSISWIHNLS